MEGIILIIGLILWFMKNSKKKEEKKKPPSADRVQAAHSAPKQSAVKNPKPQPEQVVMKEVPAPAEGEATVQTVFKGSLGVESHEGKDTCDPTLGHDRPEEIMEPESVYAGEIGREQPLLDFSSRGVLQGVVMSEVLARPAQRLYRR